MIQTAHRNGNSSALPGGPYFFACTPGQRSPFIPVLLLISLLLLMGASCSGRSVSDRPVSIRFTLLGNTSPESPFGQIPPRVAATLNAIGRENSVLTLHLGDMVFGGTEWMGIKQSDVVRQYKQLYTLFSLERIILYPVMGELDRHNGSPLLFSLHAGRSEYYSFNYGNIHFIILNTNDPDPGSIGNAQLRWMESDLRNNRDAESIFLFSHHPLLSPQRPRYGERLTIVKESDRILDVLKGYPVKAVFSGHLRGYYDEYHRGIRFVIAGCGGYGKEQGYWKYNHFYLVDYNGSQLFITGKKVN